MPGMNRYLASIALFSSLAVSPVFGSEAELKQALSQWEQRMQEYHAAVQNATTPHQKAAIPHPNTEDVAPAIWKAISAKTGTRTESINVINDEGRRVKQDVTVSTYEFDEPWAAEGVVWMMQNPNAFAAAFAKKKEDRTAFYGEALVKSIERVHFASPAIRHICPTLALNGSTQEYEILQKIYNRNRDAATRASAALGLSLLLNNPMVSTLEGSEAMSRGKRIYYLKQALLLAPKGTAFGNDSLENVAMEQAYRLKNLSVGSIAPALKLKDLQGKMHQLPVIDKHNLLIFWSPEEAGGTHIVSQQKKLTQQYPDLQVFPIAPFQTPEVQEKLPETTGVSHTLIDDSNGTVGHTCRIHAVPTAILIGPDSKILYYGAPNLQLQTALDRAYAEQKAKRPRVFIKEAKRNDAPIIQPGSTPKPASEDGNMLPTDEAPGLREMPEF